MKRLLFAGLLAVPALVLTSNEASAFFNVCGQKSCCYQVCGPRFIFGIECGWSQCAPNCFPAGAPAPRVPWFQQYPVPAQAPLPAPLPVPASAQPVPAAHQPASFQMPAQASAPSYYNASSTGQFAVPSYWYGR